MSNEIPLRIATAGKPQPILRDRVILVDNQIGVFPQLLGLPISSGFQWEHPVNMSFANEPGYPDDRIIELVKRRIKKFLAQLGMNSDLAVLAYASVANPNIIDINDSFTGLYQYNGIMYTDEGNAFFTTIPGLPLYALSADCSQTVFFCPRQEGQTPVIGLIHAGRAEADSYMPYGAIMHAIDRYSLNPAEIRLGIAPSLEPAHHEIQPPDVDRLIRRGNWTHYMIQQESDGPAYLDVRSFVADQYIDAGVLPEHIEVYLPGTFESSGEDRGFSHRRLGGGYLTPHFGIAVQIKQ